MRMEIFTQANGRTIRHMALESIITLMVQDMKVSGFRTNNKDREKSFGLTVAVMRVNTNKVGSMAKVNSTGLMVLLIMEILKII